MAKSIRALMKGKMGYKLTAVAFGVPQSILDNKVKKLIFKI